MNSIEKIAKILRADRDVIKNIEERFSLLTGKDGVLDWIVGESEKRSEERLKSLGLDDNPEIFDVYKVLAEKVKNDSRKFSKEFGNPDFSNLGKYEEVLDKVVEKTGDTKRGLFLKKEKAEEMLKKVMPYNILDYLGYESVESLLKNEDLMEVYSGLRFVESEEWMNNKFLPQYKNLEPDDFEEREMEVRILDEKWVKAGENFVNKKWHNVSHLKEMGFIFVIPKELGLEGEFLRTIGLVAHYIYEVSFYSDMFEIIMADPGTFSNNLRSLLRGDVLDRRIEDNQKLVWFVIQKYLVKKDPNDWRLFVPHINPESFHYLRSEEALIRMGDNLEGDNPLEFWKGLDWVGEFFKSRSGNFLPVSFDLMDNAFSLVHEADNTRFNYHFKEALWNKIFIEYFGRDKLHDYLKKYLLEGYFKI